MMEYFTWSPLEAWANLFTVICIYLAGRNSVHTWWTGMVACGLFGALFYSVNLFAEVLLQVFFVMTALVGWYNWRKVGTETRPITTTDPSKILIYLVTAVSFAMLYGLMLHKFTDAWAPFIDSMVLAFSIMAQLLLMSRKLENWYVWIFVNILPVPLYFSRELYMTSALYSVFLIHAIWAAYSWKQKMLKA
jgi:nicotinamide mononucleotide transporter